MSYSNALEASITRALEVISEFPNADMSPYAKSVDANWLGVGVGIILERGWAREIKPGIVNITRTGLFALEKRLTENAPRLRPGLVPTMNGPRIANFERSM